MVGYSYIYDKTDVTIKYFDTHSVIDDSPYNKIMDTAYNYVKVCLSYLFVYIIVFWLKIRCKLL